MINRNSFIGFYRHQYGYSAANNEFLFSLNKLTTPKENISREKQQKNDRKELTQFDFPLSLLSPNPLSIHYFEMFGLSIAMYKKLKEEFRTFDFIKTYMSK